MRIPSNQVSKIENNFKDFKSYFDCPQYHCEIYYKVGIRIYLKNIETTLNSKGLVGGYILAKTNDKLNLTKSEKAIINQVQKAVIEYKNPIEREYDVEYVGVFRDNSFNRDFMVYYDKKEDKFIINKESELIFENKWNPDNIVYGEDIRQAINDCFEFARRTKEKPKALYFNNSLMVDDDVFFDAFYDKKLNEIQKTFLYKFNENDFCITYLLLAANIFLAALIVAFSTPCLIWFLVFIIMSVITGNKLIKYLKKSYQYLEEGITEYGLGYIDCEDQKDFLEHFRIKIEDLEHYANDRSSESIITVENNNKDAKHTKENQEDFAIKNTNPDVASKVDELNKQISKAINQNKISYENILLHKYTKELDKSISCYDKLDEKDRYMVRKNIELITNEFENINNESKKTNDISLSISALNKVLEERKENARR